AHVQPGVPGAGAGRPPRPGAEPRGRRRLRRRVRPRRLVPVGADRPAADAPAAGRPADGPRAGTGPPLPPPPPPPHPPGPPAAFRPAAANQIGRVTGETLRAIAFPTFVADLIHSTFQAIVNASIQQMEAYVKLLENVVKTVNQFMSDNISDHQARDYLAQSYP